MPKPNYPSAGQGVLAGMEARDDLRHPMWTPPSEALTSVKPHVLALRRAIAKALTPFDGRPNFELVVSYCEAVYSVSDHMLADESTWLIGEVVMTKARYLKRLDGFAKSAQPATKHLYGREMGVIARLGNQFCEAITDAVLS